MMMLVCLLVKPRICNEVFHPHIMPFENDDFLWKSDFSFQKLENFLALFGQPVKFRNMVLWIDDIDYLMLTKILQFLADIVWVETSFPGNFNWSYKVLAFKWLHHLFPCWCILDVCYQDQCFIIHRNSMLFWRIKLIFLYLFDSYMIDINIIGK